MKTKNQIIPEALIYEMIDGKTLYYKGYKDVISGKKSIEAVMGSSFLQAIMIARIAAWLQQNFSEQYMVMTNELGIQIDFNNWRLANIALIKNTSLPKIKNQEKYISIAPDYVIEVDTKAALDEGQLGAFDYFQKKTDSLLNFGVKKMIWIFTQNQKILIAEKGKAWLIDSWASQPIEIESRKLNLLDITEDL